MILACRSANMSANPPYGMSSWNTTVAASGAVTLVIMSYWLRAGAALAGSSMRRKNAATSSATSVLPSWNLTPWRILNVQVLMSGVNDQLSASSGSSTRSSRSRVNPLNTRQS